MPIPFSSQVVPASDVLFRMLGDEGVLVNLETGQYLGVNAVGARMWELLGTAASIDAAYEQLLREYDVAPDRLRGDVELFVGQLVEHRLIQRTADAQPPSDR